MKKPTNTEQSLYERRGVSSSKDEVHKAIAKLDKGLYPGAFCKILPDHLAGSRAHCNIFHADTAGTKTSLAYLAWRQTQSIRAVAGLAVDALVMNTDDVGCVGATRNFLVNQTIGRNRFLIPGELLQALIESAQHFCDMLNELNIPCYFAGGETADVGDIVRTLDVGSSLVVRMERKNVIDASNMVPGDIIVGFSSTGRSLWENCENTGIGANGLTSARHEMLSKRYRKLKETYGPEMPPDMVYRGVYDICDDFPGDISFTVGAALLSPTRTYLPFIKKVLTAVPCRHIHGIIHCSGGGQTKIGKFGPASNVYLKHNVFPVPPLFSTLQKISGASWMEMYQTYNMGHRLEIVVPSRKLAFELIDISKRECRIDAQIVGEVVHKTDLPQARVVIDSEHGRLEY